MFLKEIQKSKFRRIRIKHLLLLLVRIAIIVFLVLAFADPVLRSYSGKDSNTRKLGIIFIDSSYSMLYQKDSTNLFQRAESIASKIENLFTSSDEVIKIVTSVQSDTSSVPIAVKSNFNAILNKTNEILKTKNYSASEIFIISDLQKVNFHNNQYQPNSYSSFYFIDVADNEQANISISTIRIDSKILGLSLPIKLSAVIRNHTDNIIPNEKLTLFNNDVKLDEKIFDLKPNEIKQIEFSFKPTSKGIQTLKAELITENKQFDAFKEDNVFFKKFFIPEKINIGIISDNPSSTKYIKSVFDAANKNTEGVKVYDYKEISSLNNIQSFDVIYLCGLKGFTETDVQNINKFTEFGKGVVIFPSENINIEEYNKLLDVKITSVEKLNSELSIKELNTNSPLLDDIFKIKKGETFDGSTLDKVRINSYYNITPANRSSPLLTLNVNGNTSGSKQEPVLLVQNSVSPINPKQESIISTDNLFLFTVSADLTMSSFPQHSLFAPIILRSAYHYNTNSVLTDGTNPGLMFQIEKDTLESNPQLMIESVLKTALDLTGIENYTIISNNKLSTLEETVTENREGKSLWKTPLIIALALVILEVYLSKKYSRNP